MARPRIADAPMPVTIVGGCLGAGKTTLINHLLAHAGDNRLAVIFNDFGQVPPARPPSASPCSWSRCWGASASERTPSRHRP